MIYCHKQIAWAILAILAWIFGFTLFAVYALGPVGGILIFAGVLVLMAFLFNSMTITVNESHIKWGFAFGWFGQNLALDEIVEFRPVVNSWRHGIGLRISNDGFIYSAHGFKAVELVLKDETKIRLGTNDQDGLITALEKAKK